jgi:hypothetical protein
MGGTMRVTPNSVMIGAFAAVVLGLCGFMYLLVTRDAYYVKVFTIPGIMIGISCIKTEYKRIAVTGIVVNILVWFVSLLGLTTGIFS